VNRESQPGHIDHIKQTNAGVVYRLIDQHGPISRIELSKRAQLAPASITKIVREMLRIWYRKRSFRSQAVAAARRSASYWIRWRGTTWRYAFSPAW